MSRECLCGLKSELVIASERERERDFFGQFIIESFLDYGIMMNEMHSKWPECKAR